MPFGRFILALCAAIVFSGCGGSETMESSAASSASLTQAEEDDPGEFGPGLGQAHVVRSLAMKMSGGLNETITGSKADGNTTLSGLCEPDSFANLAFDTGSMMSDNYGFGFATKDPITAGQTGDIPLEWVMVTANQIRGQDLRAMRFMGEENIRLTLSAHDATRGSRRLTGTVRANGLRPLDGLESPPLDLEASFDADFSCGIR